MNTRAVSRSSRPLRALQSGPRSSGTPACRAELELAADTYAGASRAMLMYGMGITQHREAVRAIHMLTNLLLMRGNIGKPGAGICPIRGHSNVQGQRTVGITEKPEMVPNDKLRALYHFEPPMEKGLNTVEACEKIRDGELSAFFMLGGNFVRAIPDHGVIEPAWRELPLTVQVVTHFNRSCVIHGKTSCCLAWAASRSTASAAASRRCRWRTAPAACMARAAASTRPRRT
jgi:anaerobic selenocysteine-containing dehydrogenase